MGIGQAFGNALEGRIEYVDRHPNDKNYRIVMPVLFGDSVLPTMCIVDTGAPWCILDPEEALALGLDPNNALEPTTIGIRGFSYHGYLHRVSIRLEALEGKALTTDATVFVPVLGAGEVYTYPSFLGLQGFLDRIRFGIDPASNSFFFGPL